MGQKTCMLSHTVGNLFFFFGNLNINSNTEGFVQSPKKRVSMTWRTKKSLQVQRTCKWVIMIYVAVTGRKCTLFRKSIIEKKCT
jgi:hypothetical protein